MFAVNVYFYYLTVSNWRLWRSIAPQWPHLNQYSQYIETNVKTAALSELLTDSAHANSASYLQLIGKMIISKIGS